MGAGKSTKAMEMAREIGAILLSEDDWLSKIYPEEINNFNDYLKYSSRLKPLIKMHVQNILKSGVFRVILVLREHGLKRFFQSLTSRTG